MTGAAQRAASPDGDRQIMADRELLFCDHSTALNYARSLGLPEDAEVRTSSPYLLLADDRCTAAEENIGAEQREALGQANATLGSELWRAFAAHPTLSDLCLVVAQSAIRFERVLHRAMQVSEPDAERRLAVVSVDVGDGEDYLYNGPWRSLLAAHPDLLRVAAPLERQAPKRHAINTPASFRDRLQATGYQRLGFRLAEEIWQRLPKGMARGTAFILRQNPLVRETAFHLACRGIAIHGLKPAAVDAAYRSTCQPEVESMVRPIIEDAVRPLLAPWVFEGTLSLLVNEVIENVRQHEFQRLHWRELIGAEEAGRRSFVLSNMLLRPEGSALLCVARERGVPYVSFQHGVSREITPMEQHELIMEPVASDLCLGYNATWQDVNAQISLPHAPTEVVGMPTDYFNAGKLAPTRDDAPPVLYASTGLYAGYMQTPSRHRDSDLDKARQEIALVENVLGKLPHRVLYKAYPEPRYLDPDPVLNAARTQANIEIFDGPLDLRHMLRNCRVIVTSRATSTVSWCVLSQKPVVFIDLPQQLPLTRKARHAFEHGLFVFDDADPDLADKLRSFLSRDISEIEHEYARKKEGRDAMIQRFMRAGPPGAGRRAAALLMRRR